jgi:hypothetical protein
VNRQLKVGIPGAPFISAAEDPHPDITAAQDQCHSLTTNDASTTSKHSTKNEGFDDKLGFNVERYFIEYFATHLRVLVAYGVISASSSAIRFS